MKRFAVSMTILFTALLLTGMGGLGGGPEGTVPETKENIKARVFDRSGAVAELSQFSMDGNVFLMGKFGDGEVTVFFKDLRGVDFNQVTGEYIPAKLQLDSGDALDLKIRKRAVFYGSTGFGAYQIRARDIKRIEFPEGEG
ncbi:hypothetical protein [Desulfuromonas sp. TF]|uniref:hypothetical protein n=1 Tax=Desulfuromonas sp. TF TaxID=1232410 RepID=UPI000415EDD3|nr:hypothetical protein [Desulfuromonas sp. TF]